MANIKEGLKSTKVIGPITNTFYKYALAAKDEIRRAVGAGAYNSQTHPLAQYEGYDDLEAKANNRSKSKDSDAPATPPKTYLKRTVTTDEVTNLTVINEVQTPLRKYFTISNEIKKFFEEMLYAFAKEINTYLTESKVVEQLPKFEPALCKYVETKFGKLDTVSRFMFTIGPNINMKNMIEGTAGSVKSTVFTEMKAVMPGTDKYEAELNHCAGAFDEFVRVYGHMMGKLLAEIRTPVRAELMLGVLRVLNEIQRAAPQESHRGVLCGTLFARLSESMNEAKAKKKDGATEEEEMCDIDENGDPIAVTKPAAKPRAKPKASASKKSAAKASASKKSAARVAAPPPSEDFADNAVEDEEQPLE
jgi:hypothetical protein